MYILIRPRRRGWEIFWSALRNRMCVSSLYILVSPCPAILQVVYNDFTPSQITHIVHDLYLGFFTVCQVSCMCCHWMTLEHLTPSVWSFMANMLFIVYFQEDAYICTSMKVPEGDNFIGMLLFVQNEALRMISRELLKFSILCKVSLIDRCVQ